MVNSTKKCLQVVPFYCGCGCLFALLIFMQGSSLGFSSLERLLEPLDEEDDATSGLTPLKADLHAHETGQSAPLYEVNVLIFGLLHICLLKLALRVVNVL